MAQNNKMVIFLLYLCICLSTKNTSGENNLDRFLVRFVSANDLAKQ